MTMHLDVDGIAVEYQITGTGEPVAFVHARPFERWYSPLIAAMPAASVLRYTRTLPSDRRAFSIDEEAALLSRLVHHVGFDRPHVVGHSYGGLVALALAANEVTLARSVALLEPASSGLLAPDAAAAALAPVVDTHRSHGPQVAMERFLTVVCGPDHAEMLHRLVPGALADAMEHADQFFRVELNAVAEWGFGPDEAKRVEVPVLNVVGADSTPRFVQGADLIQTWLPQSVPYTLPGAGHLLMGQNPIAMADRLERFWSDY